MQVEEGSNESDDFKKDMLEQKKMKGKKEKKSKKKKKKKKKRRGDKELESAEFPDKTLTYLDKLFRMIIAILPSANKELLYMLDRLDTGRSIRLGPEISSPQVRELLLEAFKTLELDQKKPGHFKPKRRMTLKNRFQWLQNPDSVEVQVGNSSAHNETTKSSEEQMIAGSSSSDEAGPMPVGSKRARQPSKHAIEMSKTMANEILESKKPRRHEWMTELPDTAISDSIGFSQKPRHFSQKAKKVRESERTGWTEIPGKDNQVKEKASHRTDESIVPKMNKAVDVALRDKMDKFNAESRAKSLVEEFRAAKGEVESKSGFSWNRERDMAFSKIDPKHTKKIVEGAKDLSSRFSRPSSSRQFL